MSDDHLLPLKDPDDWRSIAACKGADTAVFFDHPRSHEALAYCAECPVIDECKQAGRGEDGVWGGVAAPAELHACAWCSKLFQRGPAQRPGQRLMCSAECRLDARRDVHARHMAKVRAERPSPRSTTCEVCGYEAMNRGGLASHRWAAHGLRMGAA